MKHLILFISIFLFSSHGIAQHCLTDGIVFKTQGQIDSFPINYPNCTIIDGNLYIGEYGSYGTSISNLNGLSNINVIKSLYILKNKNLTSLDGLNNLDTIQVNLKIESNVQLTNLIGLNNLRKVGYELSIRSNFGLKTLIGLSNLSSVGDLLRIRSNIALTSTTGLYKLKTAGHITIASNDSLTSLIGFNKLETTGNLIIFNNDALTSLTGLNKSTKIGSNWDPGFLNISDNINLLSLDGLPELTSFIGSLRIENNPNLSSISALNNITKLSKIVINNNDALKTVEGLNNINELYGSLELYENLNLTDISALKNIDPESINSPILGYDDLVITNNPNLSNCNIQPICDVIAINGRIIVIHDNLEGCNSKEEIDCTSATHDLLTLPFELHPNPASDFVQITTNSSFRLNIQVFNQLGQVVLSQKEQSLDVSNLEKGLYLVVVTNQNKIGIQKLIVE